MKGAKMASYHHKDKWKGQHAFIAEHGVKQQSPSKLCII